MRSTPTSLVNVPDDPDTQMKRMELLEKAASSLSDGDLVDAIIHGQVAMYRWQLYGSYGMPYRRPDQQWGLMPLHAVLSTVRPAQYMAGQGAHWGGPNGLAFPAYVRAFNVQRLNVLSYRRWLGNNSKENKLRRQLTDVQIKMRLQTSGSKVEVRLGYLPALHQALVRPLVKDGSSAIRDVIDSMDSYYLNKDDWDTLVELGVDELADANTIKKMATATKTAFTKACVCCAG